MPRWSMGRGGRATAQPAAKLRQGSRSGRESGGARTAPSGGSSELRLSNYKRAAPVAEWPLQHPPRTPDRCHRHSVARRFAQPAGCCEMSRVGECRDAAAREAEFDCQKPVETQRHRRRHGQCDFEEPCCGGCFAEHFLATSTSANSSTRCAAVRSAGTRSEAADERRVIGLQRGQHLRFEIARRAALDDRVVPCVVAVAALVDQPGFEVFAVGVEPEFSAASERSEPAAAAAGTPGLGCGSGVMVHATRMTFDMPACSSRWEVRQGGRIECPASEARSGVEFRMLGIGRGGRLCPAAVQPCQTGLEPPP